MAPPQVVFRPRDHVADIGEFTAFWVGEQAFSRVCVLAVEHCGEAFGAAAQLGMRGDVGDPLAVHPDLSLRLAQPLEKLRTRSRTHGTSSQPFPM